MTDRVQSDGTSVPGRTMLARGFTGKSLPIDPARARVKARLPAPDRVPGPAGAAGPEARRRAGPWDSESEALGNLNSGVNKNTTPDLFAPEN